MVRLPSAIIGGAAGVLRPPVSTQAISMHMPHKSPVLTASHIIKDLRSQKAEQVGPGCCKRRLAAIWWLTLK